MYIQQTLFDLEPKPRQAKPVNVASVPQRSLFRYPGGKTWLVPSIRRWLSGSVRQNLGLNPVHPSLLVEPFVGGGIVSLTAVAEGLVNKAILVEKDEDVAAVWLTSLDEEQARWLAETIVSFDFTRENITRFLAKTDLSLKERAFQTILRNRVNRGGVLAAGAGLVKSGENGKGLQSRWYPQTLSKRIQAIAQMAEQVTFIPGDGIKSLKEQSHNPHAVFFIDPPYTISGKKAGKRLYTHSALNHQELFEIASHLQGDFLITYDDTEEVRALTRQFRFEVASITMKNGHHRQMAELLISRNLGWLH